MVMARSILWIVALTVGLGAFNIARAEILWDAKYEGDVNPDQDPSPDAITYGNGFTAPFFGVAGFPDLATDGSVLTFGALDTFGEESDGFLRQDSNVPAGALLLDPVIGYTAEWRARLDMAAADDPSFPPNPSYAPYAAVQLSNGTNGKISVTAGIGDQDRDPSNGYTVQMISNVTLSPAAVPVGPGYHTFRLTVLGNATSAIKNLYIDDNPIPAVTLTEDHHAAATFEVRTGNFSSPAINIWSLDYLYLYDGGAVPPPGEQGDYNGNSKVDAADYVVWRKNPAGFGGDPGYNTWRANFGTGSGNGASVSNSTVPEPATTLLLIVGVAIGTSAFRVRSPSNMQLRTRRTLSITNKC